jgi:hypothetical protein
VNYTLNKDMCDWQVVARDDFGSASCGKGKRSKIFDDNTATTAEQTAPDNNVR